MIEYVGLALVALMVASLVVLGLIMRNISNIVRELCRISIDIGVDIDSILSEIQQFTGIYYDDRQTNLDLALKIGPGGRVTSKYENQQRIIRENRKVREEK